MNAFTTVRVCGTHGMVRIDLLAFAGNGTVQSPRTVKVELDSYLLHCPSALERWA